jgi:hypothetical protein
MLQVARAAAEGSNPELAVKLAEAAAELETALAEFDAVRDTQGRPVR